MTNNFFTSDPHFFHKRIIEFCPHTRAGANSDEMTELMIDAWNSCVKPGDNVYIAGDVSFGSRRQTEEVLNRLHGNKHLTLGNHDRVIEQSLRHCFDSVDYYKTFRMEKQVVIMMHYPIESFDREHHGAIHLHGHVHGNTSHGGIRLMKNRFDIGIDNRKDKLMAPFSWEEVLERIKEQNEEAEKYDWIRVEKKL